MPDEFAAVESGKSDLLQAREGNSIPRQVSRKAEKTGCSRPELSFFFNGLRSTMRGFATKPPFHPFRGFCIEWALSPRLP
jgi:hypothetical protein